MRKNKELHEIITADQTRDLGVTMQESLKFDHHIDSKVLKANQMLGIISRNFINFDSSIIINLYKTLVRCYFDYAHTVWQPHKLRDIDKLEKVQKRATKLIPQVRNLSYPDRLKTLNLPTLHYRSIRGCLIEIFKLAHDHYDQKCKKKLLSIKNPGPLRRHPLTLEHNRYYNKQRKNFFYNKIINIWNKLPDFIVEAENIPLFKARLDKLFITHDIFYHYRAEIRL